MSSDTLPTTRLEGPWLYFAELVHRIANEYASAIASASVKAARSTHPETRAALNEIAGRLQAFAGVHQIMQVPPGDDARDLAVHLTQLCLALHAARLDDRGVSLDLSMIEPTAIDAGRCWRIGLIVAELVTNAARHAFSSEGGKVLVTLNTQGGQVACSVSDSGTTSRLSEAGRGTRLVNALAAEMGGTVSRRFSPEGSTVTVAFPKDDPQGHAMLPRPTRPLLPF